MQRQLLISATLVAAFAGGTGAWAGCAEEIAQLTDDAAGAPQPAPGATGEGEDKEGGAFAAWGQEPQPAELADDDAEGDGAAAGPAEAAGAAGSGDRAAALQSARAALDAGDEAACMEAVEKAKAM